MVQNAAGGLRSLTAYLSSYTVSMLGDRFAEFALPLIILGATGRVADAGLVGAAIQVPGFIFSLSMGQLADRYQRRTLMVLSDGARAAMFAVLAWLAVSHVGATWPFVLIGLGVGCANVSFAVAGSAVLPQITRGNQLVRANALLEVGDAATTVAGPAAAGAVIGTIGAPFALLLDAVSFAVSGALLLSGLPRHLSPTRRHSADTRPDDPLHGGAQPLKSRRRPAPGAYLAALVRPLAVVAKDRTQCSIEVALMALSAHGVAVVLAIIVLGRSDLGLHPALIGLLLAAAGVGGLLTSWIAIRFPARFATITGICGSLALGCLFLIALSLARGFWPAFAANGLLDASATAGFIGTAALRQHVTRGEELGRISAASTLYVAVARVLGIGGIGFAIEFFGARIALAADAALLGLATLAIAARQRWQREPPPRLARRPAAS